MDDFFSSLVQMHEPETSNLFAHPDAKYFGVGKITQEQVADIAQRKGESDGTMVGG